MRTMICMALMVAMPHCVGTAAALADETPPLAEAPFNAKQAGEFQQQWARHVGKRLIHTNSIGMKMVLLPPGEFTMGRTEEQFDKLLAFYMRDEKLKKNRGGMITWSMLMMPAHRVRITKPFYLGATEVTVGQFRRFVEASGYKTEAERGLNHGKPYKGRRPFCTWRKPLAWRRDYKQRDDEPVVHLCWNDCVAFCKWLSGKEGAEYGLPTEAQWEYACRSGTTTPWSFGDMADVDREGRKYVIWSDSGQKFSAPHAVARRKPNAFGLYDMHGNMWEYVADWWHRFAYKESPLNDPTGPAVQSEKNDQRRIIRGGSFDWGRWGGTSAYRMRITQRSNQHPHMSFRVAMRVKGVRGVPPAVDRDEGRRRKTRDPGADAKEVLAALKAGATKSTHPKEWTLDLGGDVKMEFVLIPAGSFLMGSSNGAKDERPLHRVVISTPFYMARHEVTQGQWEAVMGKHQWLTQLTKGDNEMAGPTKAMNVLSWKDCQAFAAALRKKAPGRRFDLPTEAQWEYVCRAGSAAEFHFGHDASKLGEYASFQGNMNWPGQPGYRGKAFYHDVGKKKPNAWGLYDMHGGVWEWCADRYDRDYYFDSPLVDPAGPASGRFRVLRGGSWFRHAKYARSAYRRFFHPEGDSDGVTAWINDFGCRVAINLDNASAAGARRAINYTKRARSLVRYPDNPVIKVGKKGAWDDQTLGCFTVLDGGDKFYFYSGGTQYGKPKKIGMATSKDGIHWAKYEKNPLFAGSMPYAIKVGDTFRLYHPGKDDTGRHGLQMRTSRDGFNWSKPKTVLAGGILDPCVVRVVENEFHLYYCAGGRKMKNGKGVWEFKAHMATSEDGIRWKKEPKPALPLGPKGSWDSQSHAGPCVLKLEDAFHMWYLGSGTCKGKTAWRIGHATSPDGLNWTRSGKAPVLDVGKGGDWDCGTFMSFDIIFRDGKFLFWYAAAPTGHGDETQMRIQIGHGTSQ